jgi:hypothetical protein
MEDRLPAGPGALRISVMLSGGMRSAKRSPFRSRSIPTSERDLGFRSTRVAHPWLRFSCYIRQRGCPILSRTLRKGGPRKSIPQFRISSIAAFGGREMRRV